MNDSNKRYLILGLGVSGRSAAIFLLKRGASVIAFDDNQQLLRENVEIHQLREQGLITLDQINFDLIDTIVVSPGIPPTHRIYQEGIRQGKEILGEIELACRYTKQPFIGITGTNGKTTVSMLIAHVLNHAGKPAKLLGNSGIPLTKEIHNDDHSIIVCELSSYQLETMNSCVIDHGVILNITPDHLDRYSSMEEYAKAKVKIADVLKKEGILYANHHVKETYATFFKSHIPKTIGFHPGCDVWCDKNVIFINENIELLLPNDYRGKFNHDVENVMAAFALCTQMEITPDQFLTGLASFKKPPHRVEYVTSIKGVSFYNDSKGTNLDAVIRAVESMHGKVILIAGGKVKGTSFIPWRLFFENKVKAICAIGEAKEMIHQELSEYFPVKLHETLESAVEYAFAIAEEKDNVLLSPGCASFDMFRNFEHRGDRFKEIVSALYAGAKAR